MRNPEVLGWEGGVGRIRVERGGAGRRGVERGAAGWRGAEQDGEGWARGRAGRSPAE